MSLDERTELSPAETDALLGSHETGVLSLAQDGTPYSVPVSYGYDAEARTFYLRLVSTPESEKRRFLSTSPEARLVVYDEDGDTYRSVVAVGRLEAIPESELTVEHVEQYGGTTKPLFEIWGRDKRDLDVTLYKLPPSEINGRHVVVDRDPEDD